MRDIEACVLPETALLRAYHDRSGTYTDCFCATSARRVDLATFVVTFYTTPLFKLERLVLATFVSRPSSDDDALQMAIGSSDEFAAWTVEGRSSDQLLMCDYQRRTRSWFMVEPLQVNGEQHTLLRFGSAVVARHNRRTGEHELGSGVKALLGFHKTYSKFLLSGARARLDRGSN